MYGRLMLLRDSVKVRSTDTVETPFGYLDTLTTDALYLFESVTLAKILGLDQETVLLNNTGIIDYKYKKYIDQTSVLMLCSKAKKNGFGFAEFFVFEVLGIKKGGEKLYTARQILSCMYGSEGDHKDPRIIKALGSYMAKRLKDCVRRGGFLESGKERRSNLYPLNSDVRMVVKSFFDQGLDKEALLKDDKSVILNVVYSKHNKKNRYVKKESYFSKGIDGKR